MSPIARRSLTAIVLVVAGLLPVGLFGGYGLALITETLIFAIAAMSLDLLMGCGGLVSFGHAAYFGLSAYATVILAVKLGISPWLAALCGVLIAAVAAAAIGYFCVRAAGVAFLMLTLAFAQLIFSAAVKWRAVGGSDGIGGLEKPMLAFWSLNDPVVLYLFTLMSFAIVLIALRCLIASQFGHALVGMRENETRMRAMGYPTRNIRWLTFVLSGGFAGVAGALYALFTGFISPDALSWGMSGMLLLMVVLGGAGSLFGPAIGAAIFLLMKNFVSSHTQHWLLIVGIIFVCCVMFFRRGVWGILSDKSAALSRSGSSCVCCASNI
jgi:branched-chain amino acid transport system permease protein